MSVEKTTVVCESENTAAETDGKKVENKPDTEFDTTRYTKCLSELQDLLTKTTTISFGGGRGAARGAGGGVGRIGTMTMTTNTTTTSATGDVLDPAEQQDEKTSINASSFSSFSLFDDSSSSTSTSSLELLYGLFHDTNRSKERDL